MENHSVMVMYSNPSFHYSLSASFKYRQNPDFYYLTGLNFPDIILVLVKNSEGDSEEILFIDEPTDFKRQWESDVLEVDWAEDCSGINNVQMNKDFNSHLSAFLKLKTLYFYSFEKNGSNGIDFHNRKAASLKRKFTGRKFENILPEIHRLRTIKQSSELFMIRSAIETTANALSLVRANLERFSNERDIELYLEYVMKSNASSGFAFDPIIASGKNACVLHYNHNDGELNSGDLLLMDIGASFGAYHADITRTIPLGGAVSARKTEMMKAVEEVYDKGESFIQAGVSIKEINAFVAAEMEQQMLRLNLLTHSDIKNQKKGNPAYRKYYMHGASHHLGLEVHDVGDRDMPLQPGMVITLEPGIYVKEENIGIRLENDLLITENGMENLSAAIPY